MKNQSVNQQHVVIVSKETKKQSLISKVINALKKLVTITANDIAIPLLLFALLMCITQNMLAQNTQLDEVVYLKNGSIIRGIIIEQVPNKTIKMQTGDGNLFVFKMEEISKITKEPAKAKAVEAPITPSVKTTEQSKPIEVQKTVAAINNNEKEKYKGHYKFVAEISYVFGTGEIKIDKKIYDPYSYNNQEITVANDDGGFSLRGIHGYKASETFVIGLGMGVDIYKKMSLFPIFIDARLDLSKGNTRPYLNIGVGQSIPLHAREGGTNFNAGFGVKTKNDWTFSINYRLQTAAVGYEYNYETFYTTGTAKFIAISSSYYF